MGDQSTIRAIADSHAAARGEPNSGSAEHHDQQAGGDAINPAAPGRVTGQVNGLHVHRPGHS